MSQTLTPPVHSPPRGLQLERLLQISVCSLVVLSTLLLSMGQQDLTYAVFALVAAITSFVVTDVKGYIRLGRNGSSAASLVACCILVVQVVRNVDQSQLLNVANILVLLQAILMFQKKKDRTYWSLLALSLLQVIVAAALNLGLLFGVLLAVYVLVGLAAMTLFFAFRQTRPYLIAREEYGRRSNRSSRGKADERLIVIDGDDPAARILSRSLVRRLAWMIAVAVVFTGLAFFAIPRFSNSGWQNPQSNQVATSGFTEEVRLDDISRILESPEQVMRVEFTSLGGAPYEVNSEPYYRGTVLAAYRGSGFWRQVASSNFTRRFNARVYQPPDEWQAVTQRITLQPGSHSVLFNVAPCFPTSGTPDGLRMNEHTRQLTLSEELPKNSGTYRYALTTTGFRNGSQKDLIPVLRPLSENYGDPTNDLQSTDDWVQNYPVITSTANDVLTQQNLRGAGAFKRAKALEEHFRASRLYSYSLEINRSRNRELDPIEDFVGNHRTGHCEYFASALTMMLRSQQIPARMVVGYKGGDFNTVGNYYIVRQLHAHAWVEAYLPLADVPPDELDPFDPNRHGVWLRLDPTPDDEAIVADASRFPLLTTTREFVDYCQVLWDDYVLGLNSNRQQQAIYGPMVRNATAMFTGLFSPDTWQLRWQQAQQLMRSGALLNWKLGAALIAGLAAIYFSRKTIRRTATAIRMRLFQRRSRKRHLGRRLDLYDQMEYALARQGFQRRTQDTPFEFADAVGGQLAELSPAVHVAGIPRRIAQAHYRVRFGDQALSPDEHRQLKQSLGHLEKAVLSLHTGGRR